MKNWVGKLPLLSLYLYRMLAWVVIVASLKSFASSVLIVIATVNIGILYGKTDELFETAMLSIVFPANKFPTKETSEHLASKVFFCLSFTGNVLLMVTLVAIFIIYWTDTMNPWCSADNVLVSENMLGHICQLIMVLFFTSTFTTIVLKVAKKDR